MPQEDAQEEEAWSETAADAWSQDGIADTADIAGGPDGPGEAFSAFMALDDAAQDSMGDPPALPKATERFPFGAKERPARQKFDIKIWLKSLTGSKAILTNAGPVLIFALLIISMAYVTAEKPYIMLLDGEPIAYVQRAEDGQRLLEQASLELSAPYPAESNFRQYSKITYTRAGVDIKTRPTDDQLILETLKTGIEWLVDGWTISVGNERTVYLPSRAQALEVLESVKRSYLPEEGDMNILKVEFEEPVDVIVDEISIHSLGSPEQAFRTLTEGREPIREYKVQSGDSYWSIANRNNMTVEELMLINNAISTRIQPGQVLKLSIPKPLLSVRMTVSAIREEDIPYKTVYQSNSAAYQGQDTILSAGAAGTRAVEYEVAHINGYAVEQKVLSETVIADPVDKVIERGSKVIVASRSDTAIAAEINSGSRGSGSGALSWPIRAKVNSPFGNRSRGFHSGIDIEAKTGDPVYSAGEGKVISASNFAGYGLQVTIDHGDGLVTMYAHLSQINVSAGQPIGNQELVGLAGTTGITTGPHLHFEVRINGKPADPMNYLK